MVTPHGTHERLCQPTNGITVFVLAYTHTIETETIDGVLDLLHFKKKEEILGGHGGKSLLLELC